jgi:hypothetical protein
MGGFLMDVSGSRISDHPGFLLGILWHLLIVCWFFVDRIPELLSRNFRSIAPVQFLNPVRILQ